MAKMTKLEIAEALMKASIREREESNHTDFKRRGFLLNTQLYNAACAYAQFVDSKASGDYELAMKFSDNLEQAADAFAHR